MSVWFESIRASVQSAMLFHSAKPVVDFSALKIILFRKLKINLKKIRENGYISFEILLL